MNDFKFTCPVCGQHISCDPSLAGSQTNCPTCFQTLVVPQAPKEGSSHLIITAAKATTRRIPKVAETYAPPVVKRDFPFAAIGFFVVLIAAVIAGFVFKDTIFKSSPVPSFLSTNGAAAPTNTSPSPAR